MNCVAFAIGTRSKVDPIAASAVAWARRNPERTHEYHRRWRAKHSESIIANRARAKAKLKSDPIRWKASVIRANLSSKRVSNYPPMGQLVKLISEPITCPYCSKIIPVESVSIDHITPRSRGGSNDMSNIQFVCERCNALKYNWTHDEYLRYLDLAQKYPFLKELLDIRTVWHK